MNHKLLEFGFWFLVFGSWFLAFGIYYLVLDCPSRYFDFAQQPASDYLGEDVISSAVEK
ncbi:MAG: hypothetical protein AAF554_16375 [Bacteroidota bacterium]